MENNILFDELVKTSSFTSEKKRVTVTKEEIIINDKGLHLAEVTEFLYGLEPIQLDMFYIGTKYIIDLKTPNNQLSIVFKTYWGLSRKDIYNHYTHILNSIWEKTGVRLVNNAIDRILMDELIVVGNCTIAKRGILFKDVLTEWDNLSYQRTYNKLVLNNKSNSKIYTNLYRTKTYNIDVLTNILDWVFKSEGIKELQKEKLASEDL